MNPKPHTENVLLKILVFKLYVYFYLFLFISIATLRVCLLTKFDLFLRHFHFFLFSHGLAAFSSFHFILLLFSRGSRFADSHKTTCLCLYL